MARRELSAADIYCKFAAQLDEDGFRLNHAAQQITGFQPYNAFPYKDSWETIPGNSDTLLYLGGNEASTHKYISEALGKSTIDTKTHGQTKGRSGSYSTNFQMSGRELLTPDEVRMLDNRYCILFIRGTRPVMDEKYELMEHPAIRYTMDGGGPPYIHHGTVEPPIPGEPLFQIDFDNEKENAAA